MVFRKQAFLFFISFIILLCFSASVTASVIDNSLIDLAMEKFGELDPSIKTDALDMLKDYFRSSADLEELKEDLPWILTLFLGGDYDVMLGSTVGVGKMRAEIERMKNWNREDRVGVFDLVGAGDREGIAGVIEKYKEIESRPAAVFTDIKSHWAAPYIDFIRVRRIIKGKAEGIFSPEDPVTRAEFTAMLSRFLELEEGDFGKLPFTDVAKGDWFISVVRGAFNAGIIQGKGDKFAPNDLITREEMMVIITRSAAIMGNLVTAGDSEAAELLSAFNDKDQISSWARNEAVIALKLGLMRGKATNLLAPKANATRAEAATMIFNLYTALKD